MTRTIKEWQEAIHKQNLELGWWELPPRLIKLIDLEVGQPIQEVTDWVRLRVLFEKLALVDTETSEAIEELRNGHDPQEVYYPMADVVIGDVPQAGEVQFHGKPEGFPIELADGVIRLFDIAEECGIDLDAMIELKMAYNATRGHRYGGKKA